MTDAPIPPVLLTDAAIGEQLQRLAHPEIIAYLQVLIDCLEAIADGAEPEATARALVERFGELRLQ